MVKGGVFAIADEGVIYMYDSFINQSYSLQGGLIYAINNFFEKSYFTNVTFSFADGDVDIMSLSNTDLTFESCYFLKNSNKMGTIIESTITIINSKILEHSGNLFFCYYFSRIRIENSILIGVKGANEESMYFEESVLEIKNSLFKDIENKKTTSSISSGVLSKFYITNGTFLSYKFNCFSIKNSDFFANLSLFNNTNYEKQANLKPGEFGTIFLDSCLIQINSTLFIGNKNVMKGAGISIISSPNNKEISNFLLSANYFYQNEVTLYGGSVYLEDNIGRISFCNFSDNSAQYGGAVYYNNDKSRGYFFLNHSLFIY